jgi:hypothetical protein
MKIADVDASGRNSLFDVHAVLNAGLASIFYPFLGYLDLFNTFQDLLAFQLDLCLKFLGVNLAILHSY